jgi:hypothetical protein
MAAVEHPKTSNLRQEEQAKPERVFGSEQHPVDTFALLVQRVVRKHILLQFNEKNDLTPVLETEEMLIAEAVEKVKRHLQATSGEWGNLAFRLRKIAIIRHLRELSQERLRDHMETQDLDEDVARAALETICEDDFERIFPQSWIDG